MYKIEEEEIRFKHVNTCQECGGCNTKTSCLMAKKKLNDSYDGIRFMADGFDCALPVSIDSHTSCSFACLYCFSEFLGGHQGKHAITVKQYNLEKFARILNGEDQGRKAQAIRLALRRDTKKPCPVQCGALCDPFDNIERQQGWALKFIDLCKKFKQPARISTKGNLLQVKEYLDKLATAPELFWVAFSLITPDDELLQKIDKFAPNATQRLLTMKKVSALGVKTSLRFRPIIPGVSDRTPAHPHAYRELIERAAEAGAQAVSMEALFSPSALTKDSKDRWNELHKITKTNLISLFKSISPKAGACTRPSRAYVEDIFYAARDVAHKCGLTFAVSDPVMKHLNDTGNCCGMKPDDPVFGNWQREQATNAIVEARAGKLINGKDYIPPWSNTIMRRDMCMHVGPQGAVMSQTPWAEKLINAWNDIRTNRGALVYFQGILQPVKLDADGNIIYKYEEPKKAGCKTPIFKV